MIVQLAVGAAVAALTVFAMEPWARWVHRDVWHGPLMRIHRTHHQSMGEGSGSIELNDIFSVVHAVLAVVLMGLGYAFLEGWLAAVAYGVGLGVTVYGTAYFVVHDGLAHGRLPVAFLRRSRWLRRIRAAHEIHHRQGGAPYGLFAGPAELKADRARVRAQRQGARPANSR